MKPKTFQRTLLPLSVAGGVVAAEQLSSWFEQWLVAPGASAIFSVVVIAVSIELVKSFSSDMFNHSRVFRRLVLSDQYLEGTWFDIMRVGGKAQEVGLSWLSYEDWEVKYAGEDYDLSYDGRTCEVAMTHRFPYTAEKIVYSKENKLLYKYTADRSDRDDLEIAGYGELQFHPSGNGIPIRYSGHYYRQEGGSVFRKISFEGFRLDEDKDRDSLKRLDNPETKKEALCQLLRRFGG